MFDSTSKIWSSAIMGLFPGCSIFCTLCLIQVRAQSDDFQPVMHDVTFMKSGTEFTRIVDSSPTGVLRALKNIEGRINTRPMFIVTEKLFENVVKVWIQQLQAEISNQAILEYQICLYSLNYSRKPNNIFISSRIFLLTPEKLQHWTTYFHHYDDYYPRNDIIIGTCFPEFFISKEGINMLIPVQTRNWIYPSNSNHIQSHWIKKDNVPFLVQRTGMHNWRAISLKCHMGLCQVNNQSRNLYGALQYFSIRRSTGPIKDLLGFSNMKNGKPAGFQANVLEYVFEYLQLTLFWLSWNENDKFFTNCKNYWPDDFPDMLYFLRDDSGSDTLPQLFRDGMTVLAKMKTRDMTLARLISLFKYKVWIAAIVILCLLNLGFYFAFDGSPSLKNHPKFKHKSMSKVMRILGFDSLIRFQEEWTAKPIKSVRILLLAFNIYLFVLLNAFLAIFSVQILSRSYFPLNKVSDICQYQGSCLMDIDTSLNLDSYQINSDCQEKSKDATILFYHNHSDAHKDFDCLIKGNCIILTHSKKGNQAINHYDGVNYLQKQEHISGMSVRLYRARIFKHSFTQVTSRLRENGILQVLQERFYKLYSRSNIAAESITFSETWLTMSILAIGILAAALIVVAENIIPNDNLQIQFEPPAK